MIVLSGSLIAPFIGFIFPVVSYYLYFRKDYKKMKTQLNFNWLVLVVGLILNFISLVYTISHGEEA